MNKIINLLATVFYLGYSPIAPGSLGTLMGLIIYVLFIKPENAIFYWIFLLVFTVFSIVICDKAETISKQKDPHHIILDEVCGFLFCMFLLPKRLLLIIIGFILFRVFDIVKNPPVNKIEKIQGGIGIVLDDIYAGLVTNVILHIINLIIF